MFVRRRFVRGGFYRRRHESEEKSMIIDCTQCRARPAACGDCVVSALLDAPADSRLTAEELAAVDALAASGMVAPLRFVRAV